MMANTTTANTIRNLLVAVIQDAGVAVTETAQDATPTDYVTLTYDSSQFTRNNKSKGYTTEHLYNIEVKTKASSLDLPNLTDSITELVATVLSAIDDAETSIKNQIPGLSELTPSQCQTDYGDGDTTTCVCMLQVRAVVARGSLVSTF